MSLGIEEKEVRLHAIIRSYGSVAVAFSAGVDSTYLLSICCEVLGAEQVLAVTAYSATMPREELEEAKNLASSIGVRLEIVQTKELEQPEFVSNSVDRCFHCQDNRYPIIWDVAHAHELSTVVCGVNSDDLKDYRPGLQAAKQHNIKMPLVEANMSKDDIRALSLRRGLATHNKPSMACLASRIPYGRPIKIENLDQIAEAEAFLKREIGLHQVRVRHYDNIARLEVELEDIPRIIQPSVRDRVIKELQNIGFMHVTLDLAGFRSGSMNEGLNLL